jgi:hypothetical protein
MKQFVGNDRVEHAHATFVEDADDSLLVAKLARGVFADLLILVRHFEQAQITNMTLVVGDDTFLEPSAEPVFEKFICEIFTPERTVFDAGLGHGTIEVEHADEARPSTAPIGDGQDGAAMGEQTSEKVMAVLPNAFGDDEWGIGIELAKDFHPHLLGIDETMLLLFVERMSADDIPAFGFEGFGEDGFHFGLFRPAFLVCGKTKIAIGEKVGVFGLKTLHIHSEAQASARLI